jgi:hypothetical protein
VLEAHLDELDQVAHRQAAGEAKVAERLFDKNVRLGERFGCLLLRHGFVRLTEDETERRLFGKGGECVGGGLLQLDVAELVAQHWDRHGHRRLGPCRRLGRELREKRKDLARDLCKGQRLHQFRVESQVREMEGLAWKLDSFGPGFLPVR